MKLDQTASFKLTVQVRIQEPPEKRRRRWDQC